MLKALFIIGFTVGSLPFLIPLAPWLYWGILFVNFSKFPAVVLLCIGWDIVYAKAAPESVHIALNELSGVDQAFGMCCLAWMRWPSFVAAMYAITH